MNLCQLPSEPSIEFVRRVASAAKLCNYGNDEEMEAVVRVVTTGANDSRIRILARRNWVKQGSMKDLIDQVQEHELEQANEEEFRRAHNRGGPATVAMVARNPQEAQTQGGFRADWRGNWRGRRLTRGSRGSGRGGRGANQGMLRRQHGGGCWRCGSTYHQPFTCPNASKTCHTCGRTGHIARMCLSDGQGIQNRPWKRPADSEDRSVPRKIAAIENPRMDEEVADEVRKTDEDPE